MEQGETCFGCNNHFSRLRKNIKDFSTTKHFTRDIKNYQEIIDKIMGCDKQASEELHKFEEKIDNLHLFRAKIDGVHIVYAVAGKKIVFLRAFKNFKEYEKFLENKKEILKIIKI